MAALDVNGAIVGDQLLALLQGELRINVGEAFVEVQPDEALEVREINRAADRSGN
jgi:hypothetical protein